MKYNDNGTPRDIIIKSGDTLPIGTEVDYDGNTIPAGWEEVSNYSGMLELSKAPSTTYCKIDNICMLKVSNYTSLTIEAYTELYIGHLPELFRPLMNMNLPVAIKDASNNALNGVLLTIGTDGAVKLLNWTNSSITFAAVDTFISFATLNPGF